MGLDGWKSCVREHLRSSKKLSLRDVALHFDSAAGEIISAISEASHDDDAGEFSAALVQQNAQSVIEAARQWGLLRAVVRSDAGAVAELIVHAEHFAMRRDWLNIENQHVHLHVNWPCIQQVWFVRRADKLCSVHFTNERNETVFSLSLVRVDGVHNKTALKCYEQDWLALTTINQLEEVS